MIGYAFHSVGFGWGDLLLFLFSILAAVEAIRTSKHGGQSRAAKLFRSILSIIAVVPFAMLGLSFLAARLNAPASLLTQSNTNSQKAAMNLGSSINTELRESEPSFTADGRTMYFNCRDADICVSQLVGNDLARQLAQATLKSSRSSTVLEISCISRAIDLVDTSMRIYCCHRL
jgi:hypothetical protein